MNKCEKKCKWERREGSFFHVECFDNLEKKEPEWIDWIFCPYCGLKIEVVEKSPNVEVEGS